jgi:hypothetical protein
LWLITRFGVGDDSGRYQECIHAADGSRHTGWRRRRRRRSRLAWLK